MQQAGSAGCTALVRLKRRRDFLRVAAKRRKWVTPGLILQAAPTPPAGGDTDSAGDAAPARVGFTVSKKVGNAVARNRARRRLKAAAAEIMPALAVPGTDYVVIGRAATVKRSYADLLQDLRTALNRVLSADATGRQRQNGNRTGRKRSAPRTTRGNHAGRNTTQRADGQ